jgi:hypothetical protein
MIVGACIAASILPGAILADGFGDGSHGSEPFRTAGVDIAAVAPSHHFASDEPTGSLAVPAAMSRPAFNLSQVEQVRIRIWGLQELSGEYTVDPDFSLSFPRIGRIEIGNMTPAELEQMLSAKLSSLARADVTVAVEIAKYRPYFIMGQVSQAGAMEWRPGLKVIQAISLAGGVTRSSTGGATAGVSGLSTVANRQTQSQLTFALAQLARLKAEREGTDIGAATERITTLIKNAPEAERAALTALVARQNDMLSEQRDILETQLIGLRRDREAAQRELEAAETQERAVLRQLELTRAQVESVDNLKDKRLISNARFLEHKSQLANAEVRYAETHAMVERARARLSNIDQQIVMVPQQRRATLSERIDTLEREIAQLELATGGRTEPSQDVLKLQYNIARESRSGLETIPATVFTEVLPGDVVIISEGQSATGEFAESSGSTLKSDSTFKGDKDASNAAEAAQRMIENAAIEAPAIVRRTSSTMSESRARPNY